MPFTITITGDAAIASNTDFCDASNVAVTSKGLPEGFHAIYNPWKKSLTIAKKREKKESGNAATTRPSSGRSVMTPLDQAKGFSNENPAYRQETTLSDFVEEMTEKYALDKVDAKALKAHCLTTHKDFYVPSVKRSAKK